MKKRVFLKNAAVLTVTAIILRSAGIILRIYMSNAIGAEGMGLYQLIFSVYVLVATFATSGLSTAVTRLITDELVKGSERSVRRVMRRAIQLTTLIGAVMTCAVYFFADEISLYWICDLRAASSLRILSFSLIFMGISSCFKGYFMARRKAVMPSGAQVFEQTVRIIAVVTMISSLNGAGIEKACFAVLFADTLAETLSCIYLLICYLIDKRKVKAEAYSRYISKGITKKLIKISAPIVAGRYLSSALRTVENLAVPGALSAFGGSKDKALAQFGELKGMALPIIFFPSSFLMSMSTLLIPEITEAKALDDSRSIRSQVSKAIGITMQMSILIGALFTLLADQVGILLYNSSDVGFLIRVLSPLIPAMYLESVCDGMLKGLNQQNHSLIYSVIDSGLRIGGIFLLVPKYGMAGFLAMMVVSNLFTSMMNVGRLLKISKVRYDILNWLIKPTLFAFIACAVSYVLCNLPHLSMLVYSIVAVILVSVIYLWLIVITKTSKPVSDMISGFKNRKKRHRKSDAL